eukprot:1123908-Pyramimonas_sp.AAC.1
MPMAWAALCKSSWEVRLEAKCAVSFSLWPLDLANGLPEPHRPTGHCVLARSARGETRQGGGVLWARRRAEDGRWGGRASHLAASLGQDGSLRHRL